MKLATSSNIVCERPSGEVFTLEKTLQLASAAGFDRFDISFYDWSLPHSPFITDKWEEWIYSVANEAAKLGVTFGQCHAYTFNFLNHRLSEEEYKRHQELVERSLRCCAIVGSKLCVSHPDTDFTSNTLVKTSREKNIEYFKALLEVSTKYDMELAVENMVDIGIAPHRKFGVTTEELVDFVEAFNDKRMGICWDFEHADIMQQDQVKSLLHIAPYLKATHVSDTHSAFDHDLMHVMPLFGKVDWKAVVRTLKQIDYKGDFCFEAHNYANRLPDELIPTALKLSYEIGQYLMKL
nr:sugar phosphate isomerase/epimerase family protein [uncultured Niameybacter sp.]